MPKETRSEARRELSAFLKAKRARISPADAGFSVGRRRTPGLRREEVARIAAVGLTWYTWLEQGRDVQVSEHVLENVARALRLDAAERAHLFALAHDRPPSAAPPITSGVTPAQRRMLETLPNPSYLKTPRWDVLAWNDALSAVFGDLEDVAPERRNMLWLVFVDPAYRAAMSDWEGEARTMLARFRLEHGMHKNEPAFGQLVRDLGAASDEFRAWWALQDVMGRGEGSKHFCHATAGHIAFEHTTFVADGATDLRLVVYTPLPGESTRKVRALCEAYANRRISA